MRDAAFRRRAARAAVVAALVALVTAAAFLPVRDNGFVNFDDDRYLTANPPIAAGLTARGLAWAVSTVHMGIWHPATWISHMVDVSLFGLRPAGHHLVSVALHAAAAALLLLALTEATGSRWGPALGALLFAVHPLRVESVAWASERKDVLMALLWMLSLLAYIRAVRRPSRRGRLAVTALFTLALLAKPGAVTLPFALLLLDFWPLGRHRRESLALLLREKAWLFALAAGASLVAFRAQDSVGATVLLGKTTLALRLANAVVSVGDYLAQTIWPASLAPFYPFPEAGLPPETVAGRFAVLVAATGCAWALRGRRPWLAFGWAWFVVTLLPVVGIVQVGLQARADRYTYLPHVGLLAAAAWELRSLGARPGLRVPAVVAACLAVAALLPLTHRQIGFWRDGVTLAERSLAVTEDNWFVENNLGAELARRGRHLEAMERFRRVLRLKPGDARALNNMGISLSMLGRPEEAAGWLAHAPDPEPGSARRSALSGALGLDGGGGGSGAARQRDVVESRFKAGNVAAFSGRIEEAEGHYRAVLALDPGHVHAHHNLGSILKDRGRAEEAEAHFREAVRISPGFATGRISLGVALADRGDLGGAEAQFREALALDPSKPDAWYDLGLVLVQQGRPREAVRPLEEALRLNPSFVEARELLRSAHQDYLP